MASLRLVTLLVVPAMFWGIPHALAGG